MKQETEKEPTYPVPLMVLQREQTTFYSAAWVTLDEALAAKDNNSHSGIGLVIPKGYFFLDIDHKELSDPFVQMLIAPFDSYTEYSVSREGIHIYGKFDLSQVPTYRDKKGKLCLDRRYYMRNSRIEVELYLGSVTNRFATFTNNVIKDKPP